jgi:hypothetical protein
VALPLEPLVGAGLLVFRNVAEGTGDQVVWVLAAGKQPKVVNRMRDGVYTTPTAANGMLWCLVPVA